MAARSACPNFAPHDLRRTFAKLAHKGRAALEQIQLGARKPAPDSGFIKTIPGAELHTSEPGAELRLENRANLTIIRQNKSFEPRAEIQSTEPGLEDQRIAPGTAVRRFKIRPMIMAQDAHTHAEQRLYLALWSRAVPKDNISKTITIGILSLAKLASMGETMARQNIRSLIRKMAVEEFGGYDCAGAIGKTYRVFSYAEILRRRKAAGLTHYVRRTSAVVFVDPANGLAVEPWLIDKAPADLKNQPGSGFHAVTTEPGAGLPPSSAPESGSELRVPSLLRINLGKPEINPSSVVAAAVRKFAPEADDDAVALMVKQCRAVAADSTEDEIAYFIRLKAEQGINSRRVRNLVGFLLDSVPRCLAGSMLQEYRAAIRQEHERERANWFGILDDPEQSDELKQIAREALARLRE
jgi:hypothetical protein